MRKLNWCVCGLRGSGNLRFAAYADDDASKYAETIKLFQDAGESAGFFKTAYGYAVFPTIGKAGLGIGGAHGSGKVYVHGKPVGTTKMTQLSFGWQAGAQGYSLIIFFEDERAFKEFTSGNFEFGAQASAVAITAGSIGRCEHRRQQRGREWRQERCHDRRHVQQRRRAVQHRQGWPDV